MRRTVKAWGRMHEADTDRRGPLCPSSIRWERMATASCVAGTAVNERWVRVTVTYDDGRPAPRKRPARKGRGGRRV